MKSHVLTRTFKQYQHTQSGNNPEGDFFPAQPIQSVIWELNKDSLFLVTSFTYSANYSGSLRFFVGENEVFFPSVPVVPFVCSRVLIEMDSLSIRDFWEGRVLLRGEYIDRLEVSDYIDDNVNFSS